MAKNVGCVPRAGAQEAEIREYPKTKTMPCPVVEVGAMDETGRDAHNEAGWRGRVVKEGQCDKVIIIIRKHFARLDKARHEDHVVSPC